MCVLGSRTLNEYDDEYDVQVSATGMLFLIGLYTSTVSSGMGGLYGSPRILQCIASDGTIPVISFLSKGASSIITFHFFIAKLDNSQTECSTAGIV